LFITRFTNWLSSKVLNIGIDTHQYDKGGIKPAYDQWCLLVSNPGGIDENYPNTATTIDQLYYYELLKINPEVWGFPLGWHVFVYTIMGKHTKV